MGTQITWKEAVQFLSSHDQYLFLTHVRPDGDTIGSAVALCLGLRSMGKTAWLCENPGITSSTACYAEGLFAPKDYVPETIVAVDMAAKDLFHEANIRYYPSVDLTIDHHQSQTFFAKQTCVEPETAACGELVYRILKELVPITLELAKPLYVAVSTDTGGFIHGNTTRDSHLIAAELMATGLDVAPLNKKHFKTKSIKRLKLEADLVQTMESFDGGKTVVMAVPLSLMEKHQAGENDAEDLSAFCAQVEGADACVTLRELKKDVWKVSLRTTDTSVHASHVCQLFGGGGHAGAAGATMQGTYEEVRDALLPAIRQNRKDP